MSRPTTVAGSGDRASEPPADRVGAVAGETVVSPLQARRDKLTRLRSAGVDPYPTGFRRTHTLAAVRAEFESVVEGVESPDQVRVAGRIVLRRILGKLGFWTLRQGSDELQIMLTHDALGAEEMARLSEFDVGDWVGVQGPVLRTRRGELSVGARVVGVLAKGLRPLPDKWHGLTDIEARSRRREVDLIVNPAAREAMLLRSAVVGSLRSSMTARSYLEVETPLLQPLAGGALARPFITHHNALDTELYLRVASELYLKRLLVGGIERVFELGRMFRNEGIDARHNPEFTMLESNEAFADYRDMMALTQSLIVEAADAALGHRTLTMRGHRELNLDGHWREVTLLDATRDALEKPDLDYEWPLAHVRDLCDAAKVEWQPSWGTGKLILELYEKHVESNLLNPTFVTDYPVEVSPLAHPRRDNPFLTERFELIIGGRELANGFSELNDPDEQRARFQAQAQARAGGDTEAMVVDESYLQALELGLPPNGGIGMGVERLVMLFGDLHSIRDVMLFPQLRPEERGSLTSDGAGDAEG